MILELLAIAQKIGRTPTAKDLNDLSKAGEAHSPRAYYKVFGTLGEAVRKAGLKPHFNQTYNKDKLLEELRVFRAKLKRPLLGKDVKAARIKGIISPCTHFERAFGSIGNAINAAGAGKKKYTREEIIEIIRKLDANLDRPVAPSDINELFRAGTGPSISAIQRELGGLVKARSIANVKNVFRKAGYVTRHWQKYNPEMLIEQLKSLGKELDRTPTQNDIRRASKEGLCAGSGTFARWFGTLTEAFREAGFKKLRQRYTPDILIEQLKEFSKELGRRPTPREIQRASKEGLCAAVGTFVGMFGSLNEAYAAAGFKNLRQRTHRTNKTSRQ